MKVKTVIIAIALLCFACASANAAGEWGLLLNANPSSGNLMFTGIPGSGSPIVLTGKIFNNDASGNIMSFDGLSLKTDDLLPDNLSALGNLFKLDGSITDPGSYLIDPGKYQQVTIGTFDLSKAAPGIYKFRLIGAASYNTVNPNPGEVVSDYVTIEVVPEPASLAVLACGTLGLLMRKLRRK